MTKEKELKTLKDLRYSSHCPSCRIITISPEELRNEAIKWFKEYKEESKKSTDQFQSMDWDSKAEFIRIFFNVTDKEIGDLK